MFSSIHSRVVLALAVGTLVFQVPAHANTADTFDGLTPVSMQALDHIRGGFSMEFDFGQLMLAMNMTQVSMINGTVIQQDLNNAVNPIALNSLPSGSLNTVIQNSLNNQVINSISTMNITITSQGLAQSMALQSLAQNTLLRFLH